MLDLQIIAHRPVRNRHGKLEELQGQLMRVQDIRYEQAFLLPLPDTSG